MIADCVRMAGMPMCYAITDSPSGISSNRVPHRSSSTEFVGQGSGPLLPFRQRSGAMVTETPPPLSPFAGSEHMPQPDLHAQRALAVRLRAAGIDAPIEAAARCCCGQPIVSYEVYGWLHLSTAEQAARVLRPTDLAR